MNKKSRLSAVNEEAGGNLSDDRSGSLSTVASKNAPGNNEFVRADTPSKKLQCAAMWLCMKQEDDDSVLSTVALTCVCVNCGFTAHVDCAEQLFVQKPKEKHIDYHLHLSEEGKKKVSVYAGNRDEIMICFLCMSKIETRFVGKTKALKAPTKSKQKQQQSFENALKSMIIELRNLAIFHALAFVFRQERSSTKDKMDKLRDIFHGDDKKKGTAQQLLDGDGPFAHLYEMCEGPNGDERIIKRVFCGGAVSMHFVAGQHFVLSDLTHYSSGTKQHSSKTLWKYGETTLKQCKKAMSLVPRLAPNMIQLDGVNKRIVGYSSGINFSSFLRAINNGMYVMNGDETFVRVSNRAENDVVDFNEGDVTTKDDNVSDWDPFNGVEAPDGWIFGGYLSFALLGPASIDPLHFSPLLQSNTASDRTKEARSEQSRATLRKNSMVAGESDRVKRRENSLTLQADCDIAAIALQKAEYEERADDRKFLALTSQLEGKRLEVDVIRQLMNGCDEEEMEEHRRDLKKVRDEIKAINAEIASWKTKDVPSNDFVNNLLANATAMTGKQSSNGAGIIEKEKEKEKGNGGEDDDE